MCVCHYLDAAHENIASTGVSNMQVESCACDYHMILTCVV